MLNQAILEILQINNKFYEKHAASFDRSREFYWQGFENSLKYMKNGLKVLDLGCGNGRFYKFLKENSSNVDYLGIDNNKEFIEKNQNTYPETRFQQLDVILNLDEIVEKFNLITIFGVTHHIPSKEFRDKWFKNIKKIISENGVLIISFWQFNTEKDDPKFSPKYYSKEDGDYFLGWKGDYKTHRYCHKFSPNEIEDIKNIFSDFEVLEEFSKEDNKYLILQKK